MIALSWCVEASALRNFVSLSLRIRYQEGHRGALATGDRRSINRRINDPHSQ